MRCDATSLAEVDEYHGPKPLTLLRPSHALPLISHDAFVAQPSAGSAGARHFGRGAATHGHGLCAWSDWRPAVTFSRDARVLGASWVF